MADPRYVHIGHPITKLIEECSELIKILCRLTDLAFITVTLKHRGSIT